MFSVAAALGAKVGDTYDQVVAEKGSPKSQIEAGAMRVLSYPDAVIKLRDNVVVSVRAVAAAPAKDPGAPAAPQATVPPRPQFAKVKKELDDAVARVNTIVNQEVPSVPLDRSLRLGDWYFHDGATRPDFNTVDIRKTRETHYDDYAYIKWKGSDDVMWVGRDCEFNAMTKYFYIDRTKPKKKLTEAEMLEINKLYRVIGRCEQQLMELGYNGPAP